MYYCVISILIFMSAGGIFECFDLRCTKAAIEADQIKNNGYWATMLNIYRW